MLSSPIAITTTSTSPRAIHGPPDANAGAGGIGYQPTHPSRCTKTQFETNWFTKYRPTPAANPTTRSTTVGILIPIAATPSGPPRRVAAALAITKKRPPAPIDQSAPETCPAGRWSPKSKIWRKARAPMAMSTTTKACPGDQRAAGIDDVCGGAGSARSKEGRRRQPLERGPAQARHLVGRWSSCMYRRIPSSSLNPGIRQRSCACDHLPFSCTS
jgi:hypothetical protein